MKCWTTAAASACIAWTAAAIAQEPPAPAEPVEAVLLEETVVTPRRSIMEVFDEPYMIDVVDQQEITDRLYRTVPEALRFTPGVMVQKTSHGQGSPFIRGFTGFRTLMLIDGIRLNNSVFREGPNQYWNTLDPLSLQRLEVVKGPASVLYGSDAIGGTVNAITRSPNTYGEGFEWGGRAFYRGSTAENSHTGRGELSATFDDSFGFLFGGTGRHFGDVIGGDDTGRQSHTGYDEYAADFKAEHFITEDTRLVFAHQRLRQNNVPRTHSTIHAVPFHGSTVGSDFRRELDQERELTYLQLHSENIEDAFFDTFRASLSWHEQNETEDRIRSNGSRRIQGVDVNTLGMWVQMSTPTSLGRFTYGLDYYRDWVESFSTSNPIQGPVGDDAGYDLLGVFLQDEIDLGDRLDLVLGARFTYAAAEIDEVADPSGAGTLSIDDDWTEFTGSAHLVYHIIPERLNLFGGVSQGFRAPNLSDLSRLDIARSGELEIPSPGLDPEHYINYEIGTKGRHGNWSAELAYFYTDITDMVVRAPADDPLTPDLEVIKLNSGDGHIEGIELAAGYRPHPNWLLFGNFTWQDGEIETFAAATPAVRATEPTSRLMPLTTNLGVRYDDPSDKWWAELTATIADEQDNLSSGDERDTQRIPVGGTPGYTILSLRGSYHVTDQFTLLGAVENLTDEDYRVHGSGTNEPGLNFILGAEYRF